VTDSPLPEAAPPAETESATEVSAHALVARDAELGRGVQVGPFAVIEAGVRVGDECVIEAHAVVRRGTTLGARSVVRSFAVLGGPPQDRRHDGSWGTVVLGDRVTLTNHTLLGGHVVLEGHVVTGGQVAIAPFVRVGESAFLAAGAKVERDVPPFVIAAGDRARVRALNRVGLARRGFSAASRAALKRAFVLLFRGEAPRAEAARALLDHADPLVRQLAAFVVGAAATQGCRAATDPALPGTSSR
jgi:UDP-N-acetylglucosamine acyltransferase